jgi:hypothetical protein
LDSPNKPDSENSFVRITLFVSRNFDDSEYADDLSNIPLPAKLEDRVNIMDSETSADVVKDEDLPKRPEAVNFSEARKPELAL